MYYATDLVKYPGYKQLLEQIIRKPAVTISKVKSKSPENPSLTGNAFENLFSICQSNPKKLEVVFEDEFNRARTNLGSLNPDFEQKNYYLNDKLYFTLSITNYDQALLILKKLIGRKPVEIFVQKTPFCYFEISTNILEYPLLLMKIGIKTGLWFFSPVTDANRILGFDAESCANYLKEIPDYFRAEIAAFYKSGKCTPSFVRAILFFTQVSHQFASHFLFDSLFLSKEYLKHTTRQFQFFCKSHTRITGTSHRTPALDLFEIKARPDFRINSKLYEIKACKNFSISEYLQGLTYLIFAQHPKNRKIHGEIKSIVLYYVLTNQKIEINVKDIKITRDFWINIETVIRSYKLKIGRK